MKKELNSLNTLLSIFGFLILTIAILFPTNRPAGTELYIYLGGLVATGLSITFASTKKVKPYVVMTTLSFVLYLVYMYRAPGQCNIEYDSTTWEGFCLYFLLLSLLDVFISFTTIFKRVMRTWKIIVSFLVPAGAITFIILLFKDRNWTHLSDSYGYSIPTLTGVILASIFGFLSITSMFFSIKFGLTIMNYPSYVKKIMRGYYFTPFAWQTKLPKNEVMDVPNASSEVCGNFGEYSAYKMLKKILPGKKKFLFGVVIPESDGGFQEIDMLCFWRDRIIIGEAKNYKGNLYRNQYAPVWKLQQDHGTKEVGNAFFQNWQHRLALSWFLSSKTNTVKKELLDNMLLCTSFLTPKGTRVNADGKHNVCFGNIHAYFVTQANLQESAATYKNWTKGVRGITPEVMAAYSALASLPRYSKKQLADLVQQRAHTSYYRLQFRQARYYFDERRHLLYRQNGLYSEYLGLKSGNIRQWTYCGPANALPEGLLEITDPEYYYGKILMSGI